ncbi:Protein GAT2 [Nakaseomyces glabratus]|uniref:Protein GAT2 n=1 Tax=Candida glabrata TaxID=5478 RepID=A0A0W0DA73_CANGB|nr:Protein GAT2 [Nakaseomyces glabratus]KTA98714.1 Protein GAT2 [Nakaseomyces glabratus]KTB06899.1 Protein GAT2 [Nakaseomyces glabratus]KTB08715.1 Protein GAT2 [Nakaseomyces glabratus]KTB23260.1 Protein GAT2 [Nakaseomyces glabratus]
MRIINEVTHTPVQELREEIGLQTNKIKVKLQNPSDIPRVFIKKRIAGKLNPSVLNNNERIVLVSGPPDMMNSEIQDRSYLTQKYSEYKPPNNSRANVPQYFTGQNRAAEQFQRSAPIGAASEIPYQPPSHPYDHEIDLNNTLPAYYESFRGNQHGPKPSWGTDSLLSSPTEKSDEQYFNDDISETRINTSDIKSVGEDVSNRLKSLVSRLERYGIENNSGNIYGTNNQNLRYETIKIELIETIRKVKELQQELVKIFDNNTNLKYSTTGHEDSYKSTKRRRSGLVTTLNDTEIDSAPNKFEPNNLEGKGQFHSSGGAYKNSLNDYKFPPGNTANSGAFFRANGDGSINTYKARPSNIRSMSSYPLIRSPYGKILQKNTMIPAIHSRQDPYNRRVLLQPPYFHRPNLSDPSGIRPQSMHRSTLPTLPFPRNQSINETFYQSRNLPEPSGFIPQTYLGKPLPRCTHNQYQDNVYQQINIIENRSTSNEIKSMGETKIGSSRVSNEIGPLAQRYMAKNNDDSDSYQQRALDSKPPQQNQSRDILSTEYSNFTYEGTDVVDNIDKGNGRKAYIQKRKKSVYSRDLNAKTFNLPRLGSPNLTRDTSTKISVGLQGSETEGEDSRTDISKAENPNSKKQENLVSHQDHISHVEQCADNATDKPSKNERSQYKSKVTSRENRVTKKDQSAADAKIQSKCDKSSIRTTGKVTKPSKENLTKRRQYEAKSNTTSSSSEKVTVEITLRCHHCGESDTPEWRRGPYGSRTLCNACGLFYRKLTKKFTVPYGNLYMRYRRIQAPLDRRVPLVLDVPTDIVREFDLDQNIDSNYFTIGSDT